MSNTKVFILGIVSIMACLIALFAVFPLPLALLYNIQVESMFKFSASTSADSAQNIASSVSSFCHLAKWAYTDCQEPYVSGNSHDWSPLCVIHSIPLRILCSSFHGRPRFPPLLGKVAFLPVPTVLLSIVAFYIIILALIGLLCNIYFSNKA